MDGQRDSKRDTHGQGGGKEGPEGQKQVLSPVEEQKHTLFNDLRRKFTRRTKIKLYSMKDNENYNIDLPTNLPP